MDKILVLSYHFPPEEGSCSDKNTKMLNCLLDAGVDADILTVGFSCANEVFRQSRVYRVRGGVFHKNKGNELCDIENAGLVQYSGGIKGNLKTFVQRNIIPDPIIDWQHNVISWAKSHPAILKQYGLIISISSPYSVHLISRKISKLYGIPYICTYGDPWIYEQSRKRGKLRYLIESNLEKKVVKDAEKIFLVTEYNKKEYMKLYNLEANKVGTFNIGFNGSISKVKSYISDRNKRFIYGGSLNPIHRNVDPFMQAVQGVKGITVDIFNEDFPQIKEMIKKYGISDSVNVKKLIPAVEFNTELYASDVLLLFGNKTVFQVPGKLFEFISTGTHILYIKNNDDEDDASETILRNYGNVTVTANTKEDIHHALDEIINKYEIGKLNEVCYRDEFEYHNTMKPIVDAVKELLNH